MPETHFALGKWARILEDISDPFGGFIVRRQELSATGYGSQVSVMSLLATMPRSAVESPIVAKGKEHIRAGGSGLSETSPVLPAVAESIERRAAYSIDERRIFVASARELGSCALDLSTLPACSKREMEDARCSVTTPDNDIPIRWVEGMSLTTGKKVAIPYSLVTLRSGDLKPEERLQATISTGLAAHTSTVAAIEAGLLELIERDALSLMWLQKLPGRPIHVKPGAALQIRTESDGQWFFMDIRTDLKIPVLLSMRVAPEEVIGHTLLSCAAGFDVDTLVQKTIRDTSVAGIGLQALTHVPERVEDFVGPRDAVAYMSYRDRFAAFSFLGTNCDAGEASNMFEIDRETQPDVRLARIIRECNRIGIEVFAVALTTVEAHSAGLEVVKILAPMLQPLPFHHFTRYLGNPRLYEAPARMGFPVHQESEVNPWPMPFA